MDGEKMLKKFCLLTLLIGILHYSLLPFLMAQETLKEVEYPGLKKIIAVANFETKVSSATPKIREKMIEMFVTALQETEKLIIVERQSLEEVLWGQEAKTYGHLERDVAVKIGNLLGAQILIKSTITEFEERVSDSGFGSLFKGIAFGRDIANAYVSMELQMYDTTTTGVILESYQSTAKTPITEIARIIGMKRGIIGASGFRKTPLGIAAKEAVKEAAIFIVNKMETLPWQGRVIAVKEDGVYINAGSQSGMKGGEKFDVYRIAKEEIDPETGLFLRGEEKIGSIEIVKVEKESSIGKITTGTNFTRGDIVRVEQKSEKYESD